jgi:hypothetical protein
MNFFDENIINQIDNYEMELPENDWEVLSQKINHKPRKMPLWWAMAASVALVIGFGFLANNHYQSNKKTMIAKNIEQPKPLQNEIIKPQENTESLTEKNLLNREKTETKSENQLQKSQKKSFLQNNISDKNSLIPNLTEKSAKNDDEKFIADNSQKTVNQTITVEQAEKLMKEQEENSAKKPLEKTAKTDKKNLAYATLLASAAPAGFDIRAQKPVQSRFAISPSMHSVIARTSSTKFRHDLPISVGLNFGIPIAKRFYFNTGLQYTYIHSLKSVYNIEDQQLISTDDQNLHYLGIPAMFAFRAIDGKIFKLYVSAGGTAEKGLLETHRNKNFGEEESVIEPVPSKKIDGFQFSLNASLGASITLFRGLSLYLEPGFAWYAPTKKYIQPVSSRTEHPYFFNITAGFRFNFGK